MIGPYTQAGFPSAIPVVCKQAVCKAAPLRGLDIRKLHILFRQHSPVDFPLVGGNIDTPDRITGFGGIVEAQNAFGK